MTTSAITVAGTLHADGLTLELAEKLALPPGRVTVTLQSAAAAAGPSMLEVLDRIHREQRQRGRTAMTESEMAAEISNMRGDDADYCERWRQIWSLSDAAAQPPRTAR